MIFFNLQSSLMPFGGSGRGLVSLLFSLLLSFSPSPSSISFFFVK